MTDNERLALAANLLLNRVANLTAELVNVQVDLEVLKRENEALKAKDASPV